MKHSAEELEKLGVLRELLALLEQAKSDLYSKESNCPRKTYLGWAAIQASKLSAGYFELRSRFHTDASKVMVRPLIERLFSARAMMKSSEFLLRKAVAELNEDKKMLGMSKEQYRKAYEEVQSMFAQVSPELKVDSSTRLTVREEAQIAELDWLYDSSYRHYCQVTHGALRSLLDDGFREALDQSDTATVSWCVLCFLDLLRDQGLVALPDLNPYKQEMLSWLPDESSK